MPEIIRENLSVLVGNAIMKRRQRKGLTQAEFAKLLGIEQHSLSRMEKGTIAPKMSRLQQIADYLEGKEFMCETENGMRVVRVAGLALGLIKVSDGVAKNHYPKGLRFRID